MTEEIKVVIQKKQDDPISLRISAGGRSEYGYYVVYRGDLDQVISCFERCLDALKQEKLEKELEEKYFEKEEK